MCLDLLGDCGSLGRKNQDRFSDSFIRCWMAEFPFCVSAFGQPTSQPTMEQKMIKSGRFCLSPILFSSHCSSDGVAMFLLLLLLLGFF